MTLSDIQEMNLTAFDFDSYSRQNGDTYWRATELMELLGYANMGTFRKVISKAMIVCNNLDIDINMNIIQMRDENGSQDYKLSRFACYLCAMNADVRKPKVSQIQAYFIAYTEAFSQWVEHENAIERVYVRGEISEHERQVSGIAKQRGVETYAYFQNAGYRGLYNMSLGKLREMKGIPGKRTPLDFMGTTELAANLFRITQTEERIKNQDIKGQAALERTAEVVGKDVRDIMVKDGGTAPEHLPTAEDIRQVKKNIKQTHRKMIDKPKKK
ncbi:MAG: hypothetical protein PHY48_10335 [Candidatus Cloacimonetes bacterium]|nr:hypothetical protein [Candidatus Cloacimonadota bacterium]